MQPAAQILRPRQTETRGMRIDAGEILGGNITDQDIRHATMISADIAIAQTVSRACVGAA